MIITHLEPNGCGKECDYNPTAKQKRPRKVCPNCGKRFTVSRAQLQQASPRQVGPSWHEKLTGQDPRLGFIDDKDRKILELLGQEKNVTQAADAVGLSRQAAWKRVNRMKDLGILEERDYTNPRSWRILPEVAGKQGVFTVHLIHDIGIRMPITAIGDGFYEKLRPLDFKSPGGKFGQFSFTHNFVHFDINITSTPNVFFHLTGAGRDKNGAKENVLEKSFEARDYLEKKFPVTLGKPDLVTQKGWRGDRVIKFLDGKKFAVLQDRGMWNDRSDPRATAVLGESDLESDDLDKVLKAATEDIPAMKAQLDEIKAQPSTNAPAIQTAIENLGQRLGGFENRLNAIDQRFLRIETTFNRMADAMDSIAANSSRSII